MFITAFGGHHALSGERHDREALRRWFERLGGLAPTLHLSIGTLTVDHLNVRPDKSSHACRSLIHQGRITGNSSLTL